MELAWRWIGRITRSVSGASKHGNARQRGRGTRSSLINAKCTIRVCYGPRNPLFTGVFFELAGLKAATDAPDGPGKRCGYHHHRRHPCAAAPLLLSRRRLKTKGKSKGEGG